MGIGESIAPTEQRLHRIIYVHRREVIITEDGETRKIPKRHFTFIPIDKSFSLSSPCGDTEVIILSTPHIEIICEKGCLPHPEHIDNKSEGSDFDNKIFKASHLLLLFYNSLLDYLVEDFNRPEMHTIKEQELFLLLQATFSNDMFKKLFLSN
ncbi:hypothetical protein [Porphyromonas pogonae]|uniref:hypothetical protein n=1 Tax=Porphyromonas pogonae TaxID=867595 RepID=UPI002E795C38|nr:hypothetical protein [Porphyromonas pogonae]